VLAGDLVAVQHLADQFGRPAEDVVLRIGVHLDRASDRSYRHPLLPSPAVTSGRITPTRQPTNSRPAAGRRLPRGSTGAACRPAGHPTGSAPAGCGPGAPPD